MKAVLLSTSPRNIFEDLRCFPHMLLFSSQDAMVGSLLLVMQECFKYPAYSIVVALCHLGKHEVSKILLSFNFVYPRAE